MIRTIKEDPKPIIVPITPYVKEVIRKYGNPKQGPSDYIFPIFQLYWDLEVLGYLDFQAWSNKSLQLQEFEPYHPLYHKISNTINFYENDIYIPTDLHISIDNESFIQYKTLRLSTKNATINTY